MDTRLEYLTQRAPPAIQLPRVTKRSSSIFRQIMLFFRLKLATRHLRLSKIPRHGAPATRSAHMTLPGVRFSDGSKAETILTPVNRTVGRWPMTTESGVTLTRRQHIRLQTPARRSASSSRSSKQAVLRNHQRPRQAVAQCATAAGSTVTWRQRAHPMATGNQKRCKTMRPTDSRAVKICLLSPSSRVWNARTPEQ